LDAGIDPREAKAERIAQEAAKRSARVAAGVTFAEAWGRYLEASRSGWGERHHDDHLAMVAEAGRPRLRSKRKTVAGPLAHFLPMRLAEIDLATVKQWAERERRERPARARLAARLLKAFFNWCQEQKDLGPLVLANPVKGKSVVKALGTPSRGGDVLLRQHLAPWFDAVRAMSNRTISSYLQVVLLTGARPGEVLALKWTDVHTDSDPPTMTLRDKNAVRDREDNPTRTIPLTPYVEYLLRGLPKVQGNPYAFASATKQDAPISVPTWAHTEVCRKAGIPHVTLKGLRATFKSLTEWRSAGDLDVSPGLVGQIMGHKPAQTAERHYTRRPIDMLTIAQRQIEDWIIREAGFCFKADID
jgi:integrase